MVTKDSHSAFSTRGAQEQGEALRGHGPEQGMMVAVFCRIF